MNLISQSVSQSLIQEQVDIFVAELLGVARQHCRLALPLARGRVDEIDVIGADHVDEDALFVERGLLCGSLGVVRIEHVLEYITERVDIVYVHH